MSGAFSWADFGSGITEVAAAGNMEAKPSASKTPGRGEGRGSSGWAGAEGS